MPRPRTAAEATSLVRGVVVTIVLVLVSAAFVVQQLDRPAVSAEDVQEPRYCTAGSCDREMSSEARSVVDAHQVRGLDCRAEPKLTDEVVVEWPDGRADTISFARALEVAARGDGWLRSFCSPAAS